MAEAILDRVAEKLGHTTLLAAKRAWQAMRGRKPSLHVFVAGMQRSGTNMLMDLLERSFDTDTYHERDPRAFDDYTMREESVIRDLVAHSRAPYFVIKALCELDQLPSLMERFSPARTVWIVRDYRDVVNSANRSFSGHFAGEIAKIVVDRDSAGWRGRGMSDETHALVRRLYHPGMDEPTAAALMWYFRNIFYFEHGFDRDPRVFLVNYEALVGNPEHEMARVFGFLGLEFSPWITRNVFGSSVGRNKVPDMETPVREVCETLAERFRPLY